MTKFRDKILENRRLYPYAFDERNTASYYLLCMARYAMLKQAITENPFGSTHFAWLNICIERMGFTNLIELDTVFLQNRDKFSTCYIDYRPQWLVENPPQYYQYGGLCSMCSGFFTGNATYMARFCELIDDRFMWYLNQGYGHADEQLFSAVYFKEPEIFDFYYGDYRQMVTNYVWVKEAPASPLNIFIMSASLGFINFESEFMVDTIPLKLRPPSKSEAFISNKDSVISNDSVLSLIGLSPK